MTTTLTDTLTPAAADAAVRHPRAVERLVTGQATSDGDGVKLTRVLTQPLQRRLDPFLMLDAFGSDDASDYIGGFPDHPHRGFETVTYMIDGQMAHSDSHGGGGLIADGDTQWMTAGAGILHIETPPEHLVASGGLFHGIQLWVNLPRALKLATPRYQDITGAKVALLSSPDGGALIRVIAGELDGHAGPGSTHTPITLVHATVTAGASLTLPWRPDFNALAYAIAGKGSVGPKGRPFESGQLAVFGAGDSVTVTASPTRDLDVFLLGGQPIREPVVAYGPFVMNTRAEIVQAFEDFQKGRLGTIPAAHAGVKGATDDAR